jgi:hypothetical protein
VAQQSWMPGAEIPEELTAGQGSHRGIEAWRDIRGCPARRQSGGTCSGESGPNGENRGARITKKI